jgi:hypothetical protein
MCMTPPPILSNLYLGRSNYPQKPESLLVGILKPVFDQERAVQGTVILAIDRLNIPIKHYISTANLVHE